MRSLFVFIFICGSYTLFSSNKYFERVLEIKEESYVLDIKSENYPVYLFFDQVLQKKIAPYSTDRVQIKKKLKAAKLVSLHPLSNLEITEVKSAIKRPIDTLRQVSQTRVFNNPYFIATFLALLLIVLGGIKQFSSSTFYTFVLPFNSYSSTAESMGLISIRKTILPSVLFVLCFSVSLHVFTEVYDFRKITFNVTLLITLLVGKIVVAKLVSELFDIGSFYKVYFLEFLKVAFIFSLLFFLVLSLDSFYSVSSNFVFLLLLILYLFTWFVRSLIIFNRETNRNFIYFFSYLCATEGMPLLTFLVLLT